MEYYVIPIKDLVKETVQFQAHYFQFILELERFKIFGNTENKKESHSFNQ